ncbi:STAS domain-containing protein [Vallicoccus soli]|uniref:STAS domain-containing protein n=1 Tax=Vallicoccus soli TaxID=2339232 RepID=UPI001402A604|nr:STAS domain-containing protein [Vallicoccus soli]
MDGLDVRESRIAGLTVVDLVGVLDLYNAPAVRSRLLGLLAGGSPRCVLDLDGLTFIDTAGLSVIVGVVKRCRRAGGDVVLVVTTPAVLRLLRITGLDTVTVIRESAAAAAAALQESTTGRAAEGWPGSARWPRT